MLALAERLLSSIVLKSLGMRVSSSQFVVPDYRQPVRAVARGLK
jgi:hypothetical protein